MLKAFVRLLLIASMAFHALHAYYMDHSDESVAHYVQETQSIATQENCTCTLHHFFHIPYIVERVSFLDTHYFEKSVASLPLTFHFFDLAFSLLKPPRT